MKTLTLIITTLCMMSLLFSPSLCDPQTTALIKRICSSTSDFTFCDRILERNLKSPVTDLPGLARLTTELSLAFARDTLAFVRKSEAAERNPSVKKLYKGCEGIYQRVVAYMQGAREDANKGDYGAMLGLIRSCIRPVIDCQDAIYLVVPEMLEKNRLMRILISMGFYEGSHL